MATALVVTVMGLLLLGLYLAVDTTTTTSATPAYTNSGTGGGTTLAALAKLVASHCSPARTSSPSREEIERVLVQPHRRLLQIKRKPPNSYPPPPKNPRLVLPPPPAA